MCGLVSEMNKFYPGGHLDRHFDYSTNLSTQSDFIARIEFFAAKNLILDTKTIALCGFVFEIWQKDYPGGHLGNHLDYSANLPA